MSFLGFTSIKLGIWSVLPKGTPMKDPEDPVQLKSRIPGLPVKHFTTEPHKTLEGLREIPMFLKENVE